MGIQSKAFTDGEAKAWLARNIDKLDSKNDPVLATFRHYKIKPHNVLEIGCANGWRLKLIEQEWGCKTSGIDPGGYIDNPPNVHAGDASGLPYRKNTFDMVIYGHCLYLTDPEDYFRIATEGDRVLKDNGYLVVYDFYSDHPYKKQYKHKDGLFSHKMDFSRLWLSHPAYVLYGRTVIGDGDDATAVTILKKTMATAFPVQA